MRRVSCDECDFIKYGGGYKGINRSTEQPADKTIQKGNPFQQLHEQLAKGFNVIHVLRLA